MQILGEGKARVQFEQGVFFNPKMKQLRDISVAFLNSVDVGEGKVVDATAASGVRGIRYYLETKCNDVTFVDIDPNACAAIRKNMKMSKAKGRVVSQSFQDFANTCDEKFDVVDIDPFGTPTPFVYDALKLCKSGTVLMVTATDTAVLCGAQRLACTKMYASVPLHNELCHEAGLRILINYVLRNAAQYDFGIEVLLSIADMHYMRVFIKLDRGAKKAFESIKEVGFADYCNDCRSFKVAKGLAPGDLGKCDYCHAQLERAGPMWLGKLREESVIKSIAMDRDGVLDDYGARLVGRIDSELDVPFFYSVPKLTRYLKIGSVSAEDVIRELAKSHKVTHTVFDSFGFKTDANISQVIKAVKKVATNR